MSLETELALMDKQPVWCLELDLDYCTLTNGVPPCMALSQCYYTYPTCKDQANFSRGIKTYKFCEREGYLIQDYLPYIKGIDMSPVFLDPRSGKIKRGDLKVVLHDDDPLRKANPDKSVGNIEDQGTFWRNFLARNPNFIRRPARLYLAFPSLAHADWQIFFRGLIDKMEYSGSGAMTITIKDVLKDLDAESHQEGGDDCLLSTNYTGGTQLTCEGGHELSEIGILRGESGTAVKWIAYNGKTQTGTQWVLGNCEYIGASTGTLTAAAQLSNSVLFHQGTGTFTAATGLPVDVILLTILHYLAEIEWKDIIEWEDSGNQLSTDVNSSTTILPWTNIGIESAIFKVDDEIFLAFAAATSTQASVNGHDATNSFPLIHKIGRGAFGSDPATHAKDAAFYYTKAAAQRILLDMAARYRAWFDKPIKLQDMINQILLQSRMQMWQNENGEIDFRAMIPPSVWESLKTVNDDIIADDPSCPASVIFDADYLFTRASVYYNPNTADPGDDYDSYDALCVELDEDAESENMFNEVRNKEIFGNWCSQSTEALLLAHQLLEMSKDGPAKIKFPCDMKDFDLAVGSIFRLETKYFANEAGGADGSKYFQIISKKPKGLGQIEVEAMETPYAARYGLIAPMDATLSAAITSGDTSLIVVLDTSTGSLQTFQNDDFLEPGWIRIDDECIEYTTKTYAEPDLTLSGLTRGCYGTATASMTAAAHDTGADVLLLYAGANTTTARDDYMFIGNEDNLLDPDGDGTEDEDGYLFS